MHIWGCPIETKIYHSHEKYLDLRIVSGYFIIYLESSRWYKFYCHTHITKAIEIDRVIFLENVYVSESIIRDFIYEESQEDIIP